MTQETRRHLSADSRPPPFDKHDKVEVKERFGNTVRHVWVGVVVDVIKRVIKKTGKVIWQIIVEDFNTGEVVRVSWPVKRKANTKKTKTIRKM